MAGSEARGGVNVYALVSPLGVAGTNAREPLNRDACSHNSTAWVMEKNKQAHTMHTVTPRVLGTQALLSVLWSINFSFLFEKLPTAGLDALITEYPSLY